MKTKSHFAFRIDIGPQHREVDRVDDFEVAEVTLPGGRGALAGGPDHPTEGALTPRLALDAGDGLTVPKTSPTSSHQRRRDAAHHPRLCPNLNFGLS
jgi:hypothetical protein